MKDNHLYREHGLERAALSVTSSAMYFAATMQAQVVREIGQPIETFEQEFFMMVYPSLMRSDFDGVETAGSLRQSSSRVGGIPDRAITGRGMVTLLENVARRLDMPITSYRDIDAILSVLKLRSAFLEYGAYPLREYD